MLTQRKNSDLILIQEKKIFSSPQIKKLPSQLDSLQTIIKHRATGFQAQIILKIRSKKVKTFITKWKEPNLT